MLLSRSVVAKLARCAFAIALALLGTSAVVRADHGLCCTQCRTINLCVDDSQCDPNQVSDTNCQPRLYAQLICNGQNLIWWCINYDE